MTPKTNLKNAREAQLLNATYWVLRLIKEGNTQEQMSKTLMINPSNISRRIAVLTRKGFIAKEYRTSINVLKLTQSGQYMMQHLRNLFGDATLTPKEFPLIFRWHHIVFKVPILKQPPEMQHLLNENKFYLKNMGVFRGWARKVCNTNVMLTGKSILIYPTPISAGSVNSAVITGLDLVSRILAEIRKLFPYLVFQENLELCRQHCALIGGITNFFPMEFHYESDRLVIDCSTGVPEIECIHRTLAIEDMQNVVRGLEGWIREGKEI